MEVKKINSRIGKRISSIRIRRNVSQVDLAKLIGVSVTHLCNLENGKVNIMIYHLSRMSKELNVPIECFVEKELNIIKIKNNIPIIILVLIFGNKFLSIFKNNPRSILNFLVSRKILNFLFLLFFLK